MAELFDAAALTLELSDDSSEELLDALLFHDLELALAPEDGGEAVDPASTLLSHDWLEDEAIQAPVALEHEGGDEDEEAAATSNHEIELLAREATFLVAQRDFLQFKADSAVFAGCKRAVQTRDDEQRKRRVQEEASQLEAARRHRSLLADVMRQHKRSLEDLHRLLAQASPLVHYRTTLMTPMESFIRLGRDPAARRRKLLAMRDDKLDAVRRFIAVQSRGIDPARQFFYVDTFERFGKFYTVDFSVSLLRGLAASEVAEVIQDQFVVPRDGVSRLLGCVSNREYFDGVVDTFLHARTVERVDLPRRSSHDRDFVVQESNAVFFLKRFVEGDEADDRLEGEQGELTVMMSDFVDVDELHPYHSHSRLRKDISVGITLRRHVGPDGVEGVVMKRFSFVKHHLQHRESKPELVHTISARVLLWGQAVRLCIAERRRQKRDAPKRVWNTHTFPRVLRAASVTPARPQAKTACAGSDQ